MDRGWTGTALMQALIQRLMQEEAAIRYPCYSHVDSRSLYRSMAFPWWWFVVVRGDVARTPLLPNIYLISLAPSLQERTRSIQDHTRPYKRHI